MQSRIFLLALALLPGIVAAENLMLTPNTDRCELFVTLNGPDNVPARCRPHCSTPGQCKGSLERQSTATRAQLENALFDNGSARLTEVAKESLDIAVFVMSGSESQSESYVIEGHASRTGSYRLNQRLSEQRAEAVRSYLVARGVDPARLSTKGYSYDYLYDPYHPAADVNRRVELANLKEAREP